MARRTFRQVIAEVQRMPGLHMVSLGEISNVIQTVHKDLGNQPWPWNYAETNVLVPPPYETGTIAIANLSANVVGTGTTWDPTWYGYRLRVGTSNLDYIIQSINSPTSITLAQPVNLTATGVPAGSTYSLYEDTFLYPANYIAGSDVALLQPIIRTRIPKIPRYKFEMVMNAGLRSFFTNITMFYADQGEDPTTGLYRFRLCPPASGPAELRLCYHSMAQDLTPTLVTEFPEGYDEIVTLVAASKLYDLYKMPGESMGAKLIAEGKIRLLKRQVATQMVDDVPDPNFELPDSSISQWGMSIARMT